MWFYAAQLNPTIADLSKNREKIVTAIERAKKEGADLIIFPELALTGYPPQDLLFMPHFLDAVEKEAKKIEAATGVITALVGMPRRHGKKLYNSCVIYQNGKELKCYDKRLLPNDDVFSEKRYFEPGNCEVIFEIQGKRVAVLICEDIWGEGPNDPVASLHGKGVDLLLVLNASPYYLGKSDLREEVVKRVAKQLGCQVFTCNQVGANDQLIFDGYSVLIDKNGEIALRLKGFAEEERLIDDSKPESLKIREGVEENFEALKLGLFDYCQKLGFKKVLLGLSGGIDSAVVAAIATAALGKENVLGVLMPSRYSSEDSIEDAALLAKNLGIETLNLPIEEMHKSALQTLEVPFEGLNQDITEENIQSRIRGLLLMALSNKFGRLLLNTGNKSEMALGYCTLYGDMCGALSLIGDLPKGAVYDLANWINRDQELIPKRSISKEPTAELRPDQKDVDTLPPYSIVDQVVIGYIEDHLSPEEIAKRGNIELSLVKELIRLIHLNEYKRRQAPPILKVSHKTFSAGRHYPIVERWTIPK